LYLREFSAWQKARITMARKKPAKKFTAANEARRRAREAAGTPPAERVVPDKRRKPPKHKKNLVEAEEQ
jgi:ribosomal protein L44E